MALSERFTHIYVLDTEFVAPDGEQQIPVSVCAKGFRQARDIRVFLDKPTECPFVGIDSDTTLFVGYNLAAEYKTFLSMGWAMPRNSIDCMFEYKNSTCGVWRGKDEMWQIGWGLEDALRELGGNPSAFWLMNKREMQRYIRRFGTVAPTGEVPFVLAEDGVTKLYKDVDGEVIALDPNNPIVAEYILKARTQEEHEEMILRYNMEDCIATHYVALQLMHHSPAYDEAQAIHRGRFAVATAHFEHNGLPVDAARFETIKANAKKLQIHIAQEIEHEHNYGVFVIEGKEHLKNKPHPVWKMKNFVALLERNGITIGKRGAAWQATPTGDPVLEDDYFGEMCVAYPFLQPLRQTRKTVKTLGLFSTTVGSDGFNRYALFPFGQRTSRNNPKASEFLLGRPHWMRDLIAPKPGYAVISADITGAEDWLASGYSGDPKLMEIYSSGKDSYVEFAAITGAVPPGTVRDKSNKELERIRAQHKIAKLAIQYGVQANTLSKQLGVPVWKASQILNSHREAYSVYWQWVEDQAKLAEQRGYVVTDYGWRQSVQHMNDRSILNFPQQAGCAEVLRLACNLLLDRGWGFAMSAPHHDALYLHCPTERAEECAREVEDAFKEAGQMLMGDVYGKPFPLRIKAKITYSPDHYVDADGSDIWSIVCKYFGWDGETAFLQVPVSSESAVPDAAINVRPGVLVLTETVPPSSEAA